MTVLRSGLGHRRRACPHRQPGHAARASEPVRRGRRHGRPRRRRGGGPGRRRDARSRPSSGRRPSAGLREAFSEANTAVWHESQANDDLRGHGDHPDGDGAGGRRRWPGRAGPGQRRRLAGLRVLRRGDGPGHRRPQPGRGADAPRRDDRGRGGRPPPAPHPHPGPRRVLRGGGGHVGARAAQPATGCCSAPTGCPTRWSTDEMAGDPRHGRPTRRRRRNGWSTWPTSTAAPTTSPWSSSTSRWGRRAAAARPWCTPLGPGRRRRRARPPRGGAGSAAQPAAAEDVARRRPEAVRRPVPGRRPTRPRGTAARPGGPSRRHPGPRGPARLRRRADDAGRDGPRSDEFFLGTAASVPVARATARVPPRRRRRADRPAEKESRGARRRRLGIPRRITLPGHRLRPPGGGGAGRGVLRARVGTPTTTGS